MVMQITLGQQYNVGEKPTVILYIKFTLIATQRPVDPGSSVGTS